MNDREDKMRQADAVSKRMASRGGKRGFDHRRLTRTLLLGALAVAAAIYWLAVEYDVEMRELVGFLGASTLFVVTLLAVSVVGAVVVWGAKRLLTRSSRRRD